MSCFVHDFELFDSKTQDILVPTLRDRLALGGDANSLVAGAAVGTVCDNASAAVDLSKHATSLCLCLFLCVCVGELEKLLPPLLPLCSK